jgi:hypothetical protein
MILLSFVKDSVVDPDPDLVGSALFSRIRIGIKSKQMKKLKNVNFFQEIFNILSNKIQIMAYLTLKRKIKHCKLCVERTEIMPAE